MKFVRIAIAALARIFLSIVFLISGINQMIYWKETEKRFLNTIADWQTYTVASEGCQALFSAMTIWTPILLIFLTFLEILGALLLFFGIKERLGAAFLIIILIPTTILTQHFWFSEANVREMQLAFFLRDLAILGGLLVVLLRGTRERFQVESLDQFNGP